MRAEFDNDRLRRAGLGIVLSGALVFWVAQTLDGWLAYLMLAAGILLLLAEIIYTVVELRRRRQD